MVITGETCEESVWYIGHKASPFKGDKINIGLFPKSFIHCDTKECHELRTNPLVNKFQSTLKEWDYHFQSYYCHSTDPQKFGK